MRRIYRVTHNSGEWTNAVALDENDARDLVKNYWIGELSTEEFEDEFDGCEVTALEGVFKLSFLCDSGKRVTLVVADWLELLPLQFSYVWGSSIF